MSWKLDNCLKEEIDKILFWTIISSKNNPHAMKTLVEKTQKSMLSWQSCCCSCSLCRVLLLWLLLFWLLLLLFLLSSLIRAVSLSCQMSTSSSSSSSSSHAVGLIPSPELQEWRVASQAIEKSKKESELSISKFQKRNWVTNSIFRAPLAKPSNGSLRLSVYIFYLPFYVSAKYNEAIIGVK